MSGPLKEPFEIKVYEIDDVERLQRRRQEESAEVSGGPLAVCFEWCLICAALVLDNSMTGSRSSQSHSLSLRKFCMGGTDAINTEVVPH